MVMNVAYCLKKKTNFESTLINKSIKESLGKKEAFFPTLHKIGKNEW
jgi:hypothetical protein